MVEDDEQAGAPRPRSPVTWVLIAINLAVFASLWRSGVNPLWVPTDILVQFGAVDMRAVWEGEIWRLCTAMFVHVALWHLGLNLWVLWQVGRLLEQVMGPSRYLLVYLVSGVGGFALSLLFHPSVTAGASGAIFGVIGGLLALATVSRDQPLSRFLYSAMIPVVAATFALGLLLPFVDNSAHLGGLVFGFLLSYGLFADTMSERIESLRAAGAVATDAARRMQPRFGALALGVALLGFGTLVVLSLRPSFSPRYHTLRGHVAIERGDTAAALDHLAAAARRAANDPAVLVLRGRLYWEDHPDDRQGALRYFLAGLARYDEPPGEAFALALAEAGGRGDEQLFFRDPVLSAGLCDAALQLHDEAISPESDLDLRNNCAWLMAKSSTPRARDLARAQQLARDVVEQALPRGDAAHIDPEALAAYVHTLAFALAEQGEAEEAKAWMERVAAEGWSRAPLYEAERRRFARLAAESGPTRAPPPAPPLP